MPRRNNTNGMNVQPGSPIKSQDAITSSNFKVVPPSPNATPTEEVKEETGFFGNIMKNLFPKNQNTNPDQSNDQVGGRRKHKSKKSRTSKRKSKKTRKTTRKTKTTRKSKTTRKAKTTRKH